jgi:hypothetical protein
MQKYVKLPFLFFFVAACIGLLLRWYFIRPLSWLTFPNWLHAHSHLMFLGWVFNLLSLAFIHEHIDESHRKKFIPLFIIIQVLLLGMLISFPLQGYGVYSITISTLHTVLVGVFSFRFFQHTNDKVFDPSSWFARVSLVFFLFSALGPFSLGPLMVNGLAQTKWYYFAVYYYLHFQYNGVFTFGVFSLFFGLLKARGVIVDQVIVRRFGYLMLISCVLAYSLSILWANPGLIFNVLGFIATLIQLVAFIYFIKIIRSIPATLIKSISPPARILFVAAFLSFVAKLILQMLSAHPYVAQLAYEVRNYVMAYLHLVLLGMISSFLLGWSIEMEWIKKPTQSGIALIVIGFIGMELTLISRMPTSASLINSSNLLFMFSVIVVSGVGIIFLNTLRNQRH